MSSLQDILEFEGVADSDQLRPFQSLLTLTSRRINKALSAHVRAARLNHRFWEAVCSGGAGVYEILTLLHKKVAASAVVRSIELRGMHNIVPGVRADAQVALHGTEGLFIDSLFRSTNLTELSLHDNYIGPSGMFKISRGLRNCTKLRTLDLGRTKLGDSSAHSIAGLILNNTALTFLDLSYNEDTDDQSLDEYFHLKYEHLEIYGAGVIADALSNCRGLTYLNLSNHVCNAQDFIEPVANALLSLPVLRTLMLEKINARSDGVRLFANSLQEHPALTHLDLSRNLMEDDGAEHLAAALAGCTTLVSLSVEDNDLSEFGTLQLLQELSQQSNLRSLNLSGSDMNDEGDEAMVELFRERSPDLQELILRDMLTFTKRDVMRSLRHCRSLTNLNLSNSDVHENALRALAYSQEHRIMDHAPYYEEKGIIPVLLTTLDLSRMGWEDDTLYVVRACRGLTSLDLSYKHIQPLACTALQDSLTNCANLRDLILHHNDINAQAAAELLQTIENMTTVRTTVDLARNNISMQEAFNFANGNANCRYVEYCERPDIVTRRDSERMTFAT